MSRTNHSTLTPAERAERKATRRPVIRERRTSTRSAVRHAALTGRI